MIFNKNESMSLLALPVLLLLLGIRYPKFGIGLLVGVVIPVIILSLTH